MGVFDLLSVREDVRKGSDLCFFNGYLEDYLNDYSGVETHKELFEKLLETDHGLKIIVRLAIPVLNDAISNAIIRYKDITKYSNALTVPYIVYGKKEEAQKAVILTDEGYLYAKGLYYVLTEPGSEFRDFNNDIVAVDMEDDAVVLEVFNELYGRRGGQIQRATDRKYFSGYDDAFSKAVELADKLGEDVGAKADEAEDKEAFIKDRVGKWFLLKKFVYVQYMMEKDLLNTRHGGNVKAQRNKAKENADAIRFVSISEMWRGKRE